jgi:hypothetical protein
MWELAEEVKVEGLGLVVLVNVGRELSQRTATTGLRQRLNDLLENESCITERATGVGIKVPATAGEIEVDAGLDEGQRSSCLHGECVARKGQVEMVRELS